MKSANSNQNSKVRIFNKNELEIKDAVENGDSVWEGNNITVKKISINNITENDYNTLLKEINLLRSLAHPQLHCYMGIYREVTEIGLISDIIYPGSLLDAILTKQKFKEPTILSVAYQIALGMEFLHQQKIIHAGLKTTNILLDSNEQVKISDIGLFSIRNSTPKTQTDVKYYAPECLQHSQFTPASDIYSYSIILWEILAWDIAYKDIPAKEIEACIFDSIRLPIPQPDYNLGLLISECWAQDMHQRPPFSNIVIKMRKFRPISTSEIDLQYKTSISNTKYVDEKKENDNLVVCFSGVSAESTTELNLKEANSVKKGRKGHSKYIESRFFSLISSKNVWIITIIFLILFFIGIGVVVYIILEKR